MEQPISDIADITVTVIIPQCRAISHICGNPVMDEPGHLSIIFHLFVVHIDLHDVAKSFLQQRLIIPLFSMVLDIGLEIRDPPDAMVRDLVLITHPIDLIEIPLELDIPIPITVFLPFPLLLQPDTLTILQHTLPKHSLPQPPFLLEPHQRFFKI
jgi:hypothetical protein